MDRKEVFELIENERKYQDEIGCPSVSFEGELLLLGDYIDRARRAYADNFGDETEAAARDIVRKIAAISVRCMENYGSPSRQPTLIEKIEKYDCDLDGGRVPFG